MNVWATVCAMFAAMDRGDVDLEHATVQVHRSRDGGGRLKPTKTDVARRIPIEPVLKPVLPIERRFADPMKAAFEEWKRALRLPEMSLYGISLKRSAQQELASSGLGIREHAERGLLARLGHDEGAFSRVVFDLKSQRRIIHEANADFVASTDDDVSPACRLDEGRWQGQSISHERRDFVVAVERGTGWLPGSKKLFARRR